MKLTFRVHAVQRMAERRISVMEVEAVLGTGECIESYPDDIPYPSRLLVGSSGERVLHVVAAFNSHESETIVITAYEPNPSRWDLGFCRRKT